MLKNKYFYRKGFSDMVGGYLVPYDNLWGLNLRQIELCLGFQQKRLSEGAAILKLNNLPELHELNSMGNASIPQHKYPIDKFENKTINGIPPKFESVNSLQQDLDEYYYEKLKNSNNPYLIKIISLKDINPHATRDENFPMGNENVRQFRLKKNIYKPATVINIIEDYANGRFI